LPIIGTVAVRWGRVGRLKLSSARANSPTGLCSSLFVKGGILLAEFYRLCSLFYAYQVIDTLLSKRIFFISDHCESQWHL